MSTSLNPADQTDDSGSRSHLALVSNLDRSIDTFRRWTYYPDDFRIVRTFLGAIAGYYVTDLPLWLLIVGPSSAGKSTLLNTLKWHDRARYLGSVSQAGLLSWGRNKDGEQIPAGILPELGTSGVLLISEFGNILGEHVSKQKPLLNTLRCAYDGEVSRNISNESGEQLHWNGCIGCIAASAPGVDSQRYVISEMGERFIYKRLAFTYDDGLKIGTLTHAQLEGRDIWRRELQDATRRVLQPLLERKTRLTLTKVETGLLAQMGTFAGQCRSVVERNTSWHREAEEVHAEEIGGGRMTGSLAVLLCGLLAIGVAYREAWQILFECMWDTIPLLRARILRHIFDNTDFSNPMYVGSIHKISTALGGDDRCRHNVTERAVRRALEEFVLRGLLKEWTTGKKGASIRYRPSDQVLELYGSIILGLDKLADNPPLRSVLRQVEPSM